MTRRPFTWRACAGFALAIAAFALMGTAVLLGTAEAYRLGLALSLIAAFNLALAHNLRRAHASPGASDAKSLDIIGTQEPSPHERRVSLHIRQWPLEITHERAQRRPPALGVGLDRFDGPDGRIGGGIALVGHVRVA